MKHFYFNLLLNIFYIGNKCRIKKNILIFFNLDKIFKTFVFIEPSSIYCKFKLPLVMAIWGIKFKLANVFNILWHS